MRRSGTAVLTLLLSLLARGASASSNWYLATDEGCHKLDASVTDVVSLLADSGVRYTATGVYGEDDEPVGVIIVGPDVAELGFFDGLGNCLIYLTLRDGGAEVTPERELHSGST